MNIATLSANPVLLSLLLGLSRASFIACVLLASPASAAEASDDFFTDVFEYARKVASSADATDKSVLLDAFGPFKDTVASALESVDPADNEWMTPWISLFIKKSDMLINRLGSGLEKEIATYTEGLPEERRKSLAEGLEMLGGPGKASASPSFFYGSYEKLD